MSQLHPEVLRLDLPARYAYLKLLSSCIAELLQQVDGLEDREGLIYSVQLAAHEVCTNIVDHAYAGNPCGRIGITLTLTWQPPQMTVDLHDTGRAFDPANVPAPNLDVPQEHGGYGLFLIHSLMDVVTYTPCPGHNTWRLVKYLSV